LTIISSIEPILLGKEVESAKWASMMVLVKVTTSDGVVGWGETVTALRAKPITYMVNNIARIMKGRDPFSFESNRLEWYKQDFNSSISLESSSAMSAIDIACWDILGKKLGQPIYALLGGKTREKILLYSNGWYEKCVIPEDFASSAKNVVSRGYRALKFDPFGPNFHTISRDGLKAAADRVRAVRDALKEGVEILLEHHGRFNYSSAIRIAKILEKYDPLFMEEPVHPEDLEGLARYRSATGLRVAVGERILTKQQALVYLKKRLADVLQVDLYRVGGISEGRKMSAVAEAFGVDMAFHNAHGPILNAASLQLDTSIPNFLIQESFYDYIPKWKKELIRGGYSIENGYARVSDRPGLGIEVNERKIEEYRVKGDEPISTGEPLWVVQGTWNDPEQADN